MKTLLIAAMLIATPALAVETEALDDAVYSCKSGENHDGDKISDDDVRVACLKAIDLLYQLSEQGYCHMPDGGWAMCPSQ